MFLRRILVDIKNNLAGTCLPHTHTKAKKRTSQNHYNIAKSNQNL